MRFTVVFAAAASLLGAAAGCSVAEDFNGHAYGYLVGHLATISGWLVGASIGAILGTLVDTIRQRR
jgi:uncharacterized membrane protein